MRSCCIAGWLFAAGLSALLACGWLKRLEQARERRCNRAEKIIVANTDDYEAYYRASSDAQMGSTKSWFLFVVESRTGREIIGQPISMGNVTAMGLRFRERQYLLAFDFDRAVVNGEFKVLTPAERQSRSVNLETGETRVFRADFDLSKGRVICLHWDRSIEQLPIVASPIPDARDIATCRQTLREFVGRASGFELDASATP